MKKLLLITLIMCMLLPMMAQDDKTPKQRKTIDQVVKQVKKVQQNYCAVAKEYTLQTDSVSYSDSWSTNSYKYEFDWLGRRKYEITYADYDGSGASYNRKIRM